MSRFILLCGAIAAVSVAYFFGHWLAARNTGALMLAVGMAVAAAILIALHTRLASPDADA
ncbi:MAG: hypothetical protein DIU52_002280 [bacterium]|jgi:hypothetical protein|nr:MAG: hypothetical protein DIU52_06015 [bacterium]